MQIAAHQIRNTMVSNPVRLNKSHCVLVLNNIEKIIHHLDHERINIHKIEAKYNQLIHDIETQAKMIELIKEAHQCKIEKTKLQAQIEAQQQKEKDINELIRVIYKKSHIKADQMSQVLEKPLTQLLNHPKKQKPTSEGQ